MLNNYPPGVTGSEYAIAGPDWEREIAGQCPGCHILETLMESGYMEPRCSHPYRRAHPNRQIWTDCSDCDWTG